jgi:serine/threonine-protein kinase
MTKPDDATAVQTPSEAEAALRAAEMPRETRFTPGTILLNRYRVISLLGRGGMGEVYRAEDMKLGQQVALKFVPRELGSDPTVLKHLYSEVRIGRDVAHPNVCRLYDIVEYDGDHFIAMQYVDGEDLASLLRRIGRLPVEKAIDIARDLCAGLGAAHDRGVIHRDLKPANVMIDGKGRAHITDFGLAIISDDPQKRGIAGTPAYMAPEQLAGQRVTTASDVYALGLIIFEVLTGNRMFEAGSLTDIAQQHLKPKPRLASSVRDVPPLVEAVLMECLDEDPANRPRSARQVLAALPGGDPLAAAVAAGETPSPEMVAASAKSGELPAGVAAAGFAVFLAALIGVAALAPRATVYSRQRLPKPPEVLRERAGEIARAAGVRDEGADEQSWFIDRKKPDDSRIIFVDQRSLAPLPAFSTRMLIKIGKPPLETPGTTIVELAGNGRLIEYRRVPGDGTVVRDAGAIDALFREAGFDRAQFKPSAPRIVPPVATDQRLAWDGPVHIEAASFEGVPVWFDVNPQPPRKRTTDLVGRRGVFASAMSLLVLIFPMVLAWRNVRTSRCDRRGAWRAAVFGALTTFGCVILSTHFASATFVVQMFMIIEITLFTGAFVWAIYVAAEPYVRRHWPQVLISWTRLVDLQLRDSLVCRDIAIGLGLAAIVSLVERLAVVVSGQPVPAVPTSVLEPLRSPIAALGWLLHVPAEASGYGLAAMLIYLVGVVWIRRAWLYVPLFCMLVAATYAGLTQNFAVDVAYALWMSIVLVLVLNYAGALTASVTWATAHIIEGTPLTLDQSAWFAARGNVVALLLIAAAAYMFFMTVQRGRALASAPATT